MLPVRRPGVPPLQLTNVSDHHTTSPALAACDEPPLLARVNEVDIICQPNFPALYHGILQLRGYTLSLDAATASVSMMLSTIPPALLAEARRKSAAEGYVLRRLRQVAILQRIQEEERREFQAQVDDIISGVTQLLVGLDIPGSCAAPASIAVRGVAAKPPPKGGSSSVLAPSSLLGKRRIPLQPLPGKNTAPSAATRGPIRKVSGAACAEARSVMIKSEAWPAVGDSPMSGMSSTVERELNFDNITADAEGADEEDPCCPPKHKRPFSHALGEADTAYADFGLPPMHSGGGIVDHPSGLTRDEFFTLASSVIASDNSLFDGLDMRTGFPAFDILVSDANAAHDAPPRDDSHCNNATELAEEALHAPTGGRSHAAGADSLPSSGTHHPFSHDRGVLPAIVDASDVLMEDALQRCTPYQVQTLGAVVSGTRSSTHALSHGSLVQHDDEFTHTQPRVRSRDPTNSEGSGSAFPLRRPPQQRRVSSSASDSTPSEATDVAVVSAAGASDATVRPRPSKGKSMPPDVTRTLMGWFLAHVDRPYPTPEEKEELMAATGLDATQLRNFMTNQRKRHWRPILSGRAPRSRMELMLQLRAQEKIN